MPAGGDPAALARRLSGLGVEAGELVVDAGCGTGRYTEALRNAGFRVVGVDASEALLNVARGRAPEVTFVCADLLAWEPDEPAAAVLCRGVLNDLVDDRARGGAFRSFRSWLRPGGVLLADVRDWEATAARYADASTHERTATRDGRTLRFASDTRLDPERHLMLVHERYDGETYDFTMRCWTADELRDHAAAAGFAEVDVRPGAAPDRLALVARS